MPRNDSRLMPRGAFSETNLKLLSIYTLIIFPTRFQQQINFIQIPIRQAKSLCRCPIRVSAEAFHIHLRFNHRTTHPMLHPRPHTNLGSLPRGLRDCRSHPGCFRNCCLPMYLMVSKEGQNWGGQEVSHNK